MTGRADIERDRGFITESDISEVLHEPGNQSESCLTSVQGKTKRTGDALNYVTKSATKRVGDMMCTCEDDGF